MSYSPDFHQKVPTNQPTQHLKLKTIEPSRHRLFAQWSARKIRIFKKIFVPSPTSTYVNSHIKKSPDFRPNAQVRPNYRGSRSFRTGKPLGELPIMSIENPTLVHFRHFSSLYTNEYRVSRYESFMQNKAKLLNAQMNVTKVLTKDYENERLHRRGKNKAK